ncbi:hypothetical protein [Silvibacterium dinghuense]|uniref:Uncharacterized protein n=1 Tax=Silvibacterium dinghuense TaxID=1560006 RepID=A0A4Q1S8E9_9BACT|nr:hypothetical protein [Silvibacterium dinghuense]RXS93262.1 hypothetical protein ESZ00_18025 [Silvibacterium dinghuense]GGH04401.1 hypothetical protein GCM10011586_20500 [Silvibacterium dinghuense]
MHPEDRALWAARAAELSHAASAGGYALESVGPDHLPQGWQVDQSVCPLMSDVLLLHYRRTFEDGRESLFTAILPRNGGHVRVLEILHRGAATFVPTITSRQTLELFNHLVAKEELRNAMKPYGSWLAAGVCYAELNGMEPRVPRRPETDPATAGAMPPSLLLDGENGDRRIIFSDRASEHGYTVWTVVVDAQGVLRSAREEEEHTTWQRKPASH